MLRSILLVLACAGVASGELLSEVRLFNNGFPRPHNLEMRAVRPDGIAIGIAGAHNIKPGDVGIERFVAADNSTGTIELERWLVNESLEPLHPWDINVFLVVDWGAIYPLSPSEMTNTFTSHVVSVTSNIPSHDYSFAGYDITGFGFLVEHSGDAIYRVYGNAIAPEPSSAILLLGMLLPLVGIRWRVHGEIA